MPTLQWVGKDKVVNHHLDVPFRVLNNVSSFRAPEGTLANSTDKAGPHYRYMMVFDNNPIEGAERLSDALKKIGQL
ncbi:MAG: hypothetical protein Q8N13_13460 [Acidovorax sp.]|nr:hypothetical protein [Acidovorax sp.]